MHYERLRGPIISGKGPLFETHNRRSVPRREPFLMVESRCGAVAVGWAYLFPPLSSGGASLAQPWRRFHIPLIGRVEDWRAGRPCDRATFPAPATSHAACGFPALRAPICFIPRFMGPIWLGQLSVRCVALDSC